MVNPTVVYYSGSYSMLILWTAVRVLMSDWANLEGEPSYSYYYSGFYFAPQSEALVRWTVCVCRLVILVPS